MGQPPYRLVWISHFSLPSPWENNQHSLSTHPHPASDRHPGLKQCLFPDRLFPNSRAPSPYAHQSPSNLQWFEGGEKPFRNKHFECLLKPKWVRGAIQSCGSHLGLWASWTCAAALGTTSHSGPANPQQHSWWAHPSACSARLCVPAPSDLL